ncbi:hypothetical protein QBC44DRAFT_304864 [Cladorrhinum sp. PSN332]|nr:hypothetical protein QBC44DRAFT_304864 [Cladorrhinum sp. PSN332]
MARPSGTKSAVDSCALVLALPAEMVATNTKYVFLAGECSVPAVCPSQYPESIEVVCILRIPIGFSGDRQARKHWPPRQLRDVGSARTRKPRWSSQCGPESLTRTGCDPPIKIASHKNTPADLDRILPRFASEEHGVIRYYPDSWASTGTGASFGAVASKYRRSSCVSPCTTVLSNQMAKAAREMVLNRICCLSQGTGWMMKDEMSVGRGLSVCKKHAYRPRLWVRHSPGQQAVRTPLF